MPKISLRRESASGASGKIWVRTPTPITVSKTVEAVKPASVIATTRSVTENAVSNMLSVIRATFKQTGNEDATRTTVENRRGSSASRGRGLKKTRA